MVNKARSATITATVTIDVTHMRGAAGYTEIQSVDVPEMKIGTVWVDLDDFRDGDDSTIGDKLIERYSEILAVLVDRQMKDRF